MSLNQVTHEKDGLRAVFRRKIGGDVLDASTIHNILAEYIRKQLKVPAAGKLPVRFWGRIIFVVNVMQQTVSLTGEGHFDIPDIDAPDQDIIDFYEFVMTFNEEQIEFFREGLRKFDAVPNQDGGQDEPASNPDSTKRRETLRETNAIPA